MFDLVYFSCAIPLAALVLLLQRSAFLSLLSWIFLIVPCDIYSLCCWAFFPSTASHVLVSASFTNCQWFSTLSSSSCDSALYLLERVMQNSFFVSCSWRKFTFYFTLWFCVKENLFSFNLNLAISRWWSDATSAPLKTFTSWRELLNLLLMQT